MSHDNLKFHNSHVVEGQNISAKTSHMSSQLFNLVTDITRASSITSIFVADFPYHQTISRNIYLTVMNSMKIHFYQFWYFRLILLHPL